MNMQHLNWYKTFKIRHFPYIDIVEDIMSISWVLFVLMVLYVVFDKNHILTITNGKVEVEFWNFILFIFNVAFVIKLLITLVSYCCELYENFKDYYIPHFKRK